MHGGQGRPLEQSSRAVREGAAHMRGVGTAGAKVPRWGFSGTAKEASIGVRVREQSAP